MICKKCHQWFRKKTYARHKRVCVPSVYQPSMIHYIESKSQSAKTEEAQKKARTRKDD